MNVILRKKAARRIRDRGGHEFASDWSDSGECGNPACSGRWLWFVKDRRRPVFEGYWGCTVKCLETMARAAVRRESGEGGVGERKGEYLHRLPLGLILLAQGWITQKQLRHALSRQQLAGSGRIGHWLTEECQLQSNCITRGLAVQWQCPVLEMDRFDPERMALAAPRLLVEETGMLPLRVAEGRTLQLGFADRPDPPAAFAMKRMSGLKVESGLLYPGEWKSAQRRLCACDFVDAALEQVAATELLPERIAAALSGLRPRASQLVRVHGFYWLRMWLEKSVAGVPFRREDVADRIYAIDTEQ